jgi:hypothetical protein
MYRMCNSCKIVINIEFCRQIFKKIHEYFILLKLRPMGFELFHADGQRDMRNLTVAVRNCMECTMHLISQYLPCRQLLTPDVIKAYFVVPGCLRSTCRKQFWFQKVSDVFLVLKVFGLHLCW